MDYVSGQMDQVECLYVWVHTSIFSSRDANEGLGWFDGNLYQPWISLGFGDPYLTRLLNRSITMDLSWDLFVN